MRRLSLVLGSIAAAFLLTLGVSIERDGTVRVPTAAAQGTPAEITSPTPGTSIGSPTTFAWNTGSNVLEYWLYVGTTGVGSANIFNQLTGTTRTATVNNIPGGTIYVRLWSRLSTGWQFRDYTYSCCGSPAEITSPTPGTSIGSPTTFAWNTGSNVLEYWLYVGTTGVGSANIFNQLTGTTRTATVNNIPGGTIYVRLWSRLSDGWQYRDYTYTCCGLSAEITSPTPGTTISSSTSFAWNTGSNVLEYWLYVGTTGVGSANIFNQTTGTTRTATVNNIPGGTIYVRLWSRLSTGWQFRDYTYTCGTPAAHEFTGDGRSDIVWRHTSTGAVAVWQMNGGTVAFSHPLGSAPADWSIVGQRDFDANGQDDLLWRNTTTGAVAIWFVNPGSTLQVVPANVGILPTNWSVVGTGDFNANGMGDLLSRDTSGNIAIWLMNGAQVAQGSVIGQVPTAWSVAAVADFNGDGRADILWRNTSTGQAAIWFINGVTVTSSAVIGTVPTTWSIVATGDFNADSKADIVWRDTSGNVAIWLMNGASVLQQGVFAAVSNNWVIVETGDFEGNGKADILWRDTNTGTVAIWFMDGMSISSAPVVATPPTDWVVQNLNAN